MLNLQITQLCHHFINEYVAEGSVCIDATAGNGYDTAFLCSLVGDSGHVLAFDIQQKALDNTAARLLKLGLSDRAEIIRDSHCNMHKYTPEASVDCIVFNFGYLPDGDHSVCTHADTSVAAINTALSLLKKGGLLSLCVYSGGDTGFEEKTAILNFVKGLSQKQYTVLRIDYYNKSNNPPMPVMIIKL